VQKKKKSEHNIVLEKHSLDGGFCGEEQSALEMNLSVYGLVFARYGEGVLERQLMVQDLWGLTLCPVASAERSPSHSRLSCSSVAGRSGATTTAQCSKMFFTYAV
jgi:hypothetical protein